MKLGLLFIGDGRRTYLDAAVQGAFANVLHPIHARLMVNDEADSLYCAELDAAYPEYTIAHTGRVGMAAAVLAGFALAASHDVDHLLWIEEDMVITRRLPIPSAAGILDVHPEYAQMCFPRAVCDPSEGDSVFATTADASPHHEIHPTYETLDGLFTFQPCLIPKSTLKLAGFPCPPGVGIETHLTGLLLESGSIFAWYGHPSDEPYATHIGYASRSEGYKW